MKKVLDVKKALATLSNPAKAKILSGFFKTGKGQYGEGDLFIGVTVPQSRSVAKSHSSLSLLELSKLLQSKIHEERLVALLILGLQFKKADKSGQEKIYRFFLKHLKYINNWDLVDTSAPYIAGPYLFENPDNLKILNKLAKSKSLWDRRVAMLSTFYFIRQNSFTEALKIAEILVHDEHDLIHKAVGWMLREIGNRSQETEERFLKKYAASMPRTMLRYAIEKLPAAKKTKYMSLKGVGK